MRIRATAIVAAAVLALAAPGAQAAQVIAINKVTVPPESDVVVTVNMTQPAETFGGSDELEVTGTTGTELEVAGGTLTDDKYNNGLYYVRMTTGDAAGRWSTISSNDADAVVLADTSFLADVDAGDEFTIFPHMKLVDVFPASSENLSMVASVAHSSGLFFETLRTQVRVFDGAAPGLNKTPTATYVFYNGHWRKVGESLSADFDDAILRPDTFFVVRNVNWSFALSFVPKGRLPFEVRSIEMTNGVANDVLVSSFRPVAVKLSELGLGGTDAFVDSQAHVSGLFVETFGDQLWLFDPTDAVLNPPHTTYYFLNGHWRKVGEGLTEEFDDIVIQAGQGVVLRKGGDLGSGTATWTNQAPYPEP